MKKGFWVYGTPDIMIAALDKRIGRRFAAIENRLKENRAFTEKFFREHPEAKLYRMARGAAL